MYDLEFITLLQNSKKLTIDELYYLLNDDILFHDIVVCGHSRLGGTDPSEEIHTHSKNKNKFYNFRADGPNAVLKITSRDSEEVESYSFDGADFNEVKSWMSGIKVFNHQVILSTMKMFASMECNFQ